MSEFWGPFQKSLEDAKEHMESVKVPPKETGETPKRGGPLVIRESRFGEFVGCSGYPECKTIITTPKNLGRNLPSSRVWRRTNREALQAWQDLLWVQQVPRVRFSSPGTSRWTENVPSANPCSSKRSGLAAPRESNASTNHAITKNPQNRRKKRNKCLR